MPLNVASPSELVKTIGFAHTAATTAKLPVAISRKLFIPLNDRGANEHNAFVYESELDNVPAATGQAWTPGQPLHWDAAAGVFTTTATDNTLCGHVLQPKAADAAVGPLVAYNAFAA